MKIHFGMLLVTFSLVFVFHMDRPDFLSGHHGWVSAHGLAIINRATLGNGFLGYTTQTVNKAGERDKGYFDRYPVFFSAFAKVIIDQFADDTSVSQVRVARLLMDGIYILSILASVWLLVLLGLSALRSWAVSLTAFSGYFFVYYKDMVHFDQPALLGMILLTSCIFLYWQRGIAWPVLLLAPLAILSGRGYASFAVLLLALLMELRRLGLVKIASSPVFRASCLAFVIAVASLGYNVLSESQIRQVPLSETSIVKSATARLLGTKSFNKQHKEALRWGRFLESQVKRTIHGSLPKYLEFLHVKQDIKPLNAVIGILFFIFMVYSIRQLFVEFEQKSRWMLWFLFFVGWFWLIPMKNLAAFHDYTAMYCFGTFLVIWMAFLRWLREDRVALVFAVVFFTVALQQNYRSERGPAAEVRTDPIAKVLQKLPNSSVVYYQEGYRELFPGVPYAPFFVAPHVWFTEFKQHASVEVIQNGEKWELRKLK